MGSARVDHHSPCYKKHIDLKRSTHSVARRSNLKVLWLKTLLNYVMRQKVFSRAFAFVENASQKIEVNRLYHAPRDAEAEQCSSVNYSALALSGDNGS